jgi:hypothetical protein
MNNRLLPLTPPQPPFSTRLPRLGLPSLTLITMPWIELGVLTVMIVGLVRIGS